MGAHLHEQPDGAGEHAGPACQPDRELSRDSFVAGGPQPVDEDRLAEMMRNADIRVLVSTEEGGDDDSTVGSTLIDPKADLDDIVSRRHESEQIRKVLQALPERERLIVELYYYRDRNFKEIADTLGVTESRVSQLHTRMKKRFRELLECQLNA